MTFKTMSQLITDVEQALYQSASPAVQLYSQDAILMMIQDAFDHLFTKKWWPQFRKRETVTLSSGYPVTPPVNFTSYEDIRYVFGPYSNRPLSSLPMSMNTTQAGFNVGARARWIEGDADKVFRIWPTTTTDTVLVIGRKRPAPFIITDTVPFDSTVLKHFAAWSYFVDDGSNPGAVAKHQGLFEARLSQLEEDNFNEPIQLDGAADRVPNQWTEGRY